MNPFGVSAAAILALMCALAPSHTDAFYYEDCMTNGQYNQNNVTHVHEAEIHPTTVVAPGELQVTMDFEILQNVPGDLELSVRVQKKVWWFWVTGHQSTHSLCSLLSTSLSEEYGTTACPSQLANAYIPCRCPFTQGRYTLPWTSFDITKPDDIPYGRYWAEARLTHPITGELKGCHSMGFYLSSY
ncbi:ganglioside GM2 activator-like [Argopecten irradians]|uniref:ganglioside GM2 activator-like n=1 Tax=Argopecten irradians TaxID=31199 RepID=UPI0037242126